jgi:hypothetical protein
MLFDWRFSEDVSRELWLPMGPSGCVPIASQDTFARNYNDGIGQGTASDRLEVLVAADKPAVTNEVRQAAIALRGPLPQIHRLGSTVDFGVSVTKCVC